MKSKIMVAVACTLLSNSLFPSAALAGRAGYLCQVSVEQDPARTIELKATHDIQDIALPDGGKLQLSTYVGFVQAFVKDAADQTIFSAMAPEEGFTRLLVHSVSPRVNVNCTARPAVGDHD